MTFEVGAVLEDAKWQAPVYCFEKKGIKTGYNAVDDNFLKPQLEGVLKGSMQL